MNKLFDLFWKSNMAEKKEVGAGPTCEPGMSCIQTYLFVLEVDVVGFSCFDGVGVEDVRSDLLAVHVDTAAELDGGAGFHSRDHQHPPQRGVQPCRV